jgi:hypothetical protein
MRRLEQFMRFASRAFGFGSEHAHRIVRNRRTNFARFCV